MLYYLPFYFETCKDQSASTAGLSLIPITGSMVVTAPVMSNVITKSGYYRWSLWLGFILAIIFHGLLSRLDSDIRPMHWIPILSKQYISITNLLSFSEYQKIRVSNNAQILASSDIYKFVQFLSFF